MNFKVVSRQKDRQTTTIYLNSYLLKIIWTQKEIPVTYTISLEDLFNSILPLIRKENWNDFKINFELKLLFWLCRLDENLSLLKPHISFYVCKFT